MTASKKALNHPHKHWASLPQLKCLFCLVLNNFGFICTGVSTESSYKKNAAWYNLNVCVATILL